MSAARASAASLRFEHLVADGNRLYWAEGRPSEQGRVVIVRRDPDGSLTDVTPAGFNVRSRVHEYGGAAFTVHEDTIYFVNFADQRLHRHPAGDPPQPLSEAGCRYADLRVDPARQALYAVREDHRDQERSGAAGEPTNALVIRSLVDNEERVVRSGADFYSSPRVSPDGTQLCWLQWNHPHLPWESTELWVGDLRRDGSVAQAHVAAGGPRESVFQPEWMPDGQLVFVSDRSGWWNLYRLDMRASHSLSPPVAEPLAPMSADCGKPQWTFSQTTYGVVDANTLAVSFAQGGRWHLGLLTFEPRSFAPVTLAIEPTDGVRCVGREVFLIGGAPTQPLSVARWPLEADGALEIVRSASESLPEQAPVSTATPLVFDSEGRDVHAFLYLPRSADHQAPADERPPLLVLSHGGPTAAATDVFDPRIQFWTSRGFAVVDVNYSGSTGFGRAYRDRLERQWGVVDVEDCVNAARYLVSRELVDPRRLAIRGGSAGGYTTLSALTFFDVFRAGASHYGVSDLEVLVADTHKFESRYGDWLIGPYPECREVYRARSPIHFTDRLSAALILFQGLDDKIVPPNQAEMMANTLRAKGLPVAYVPFAGEQHGFRQAANIIRALEAELYFYGAVFGFTPAGAIEPVVIDNLLG